MNPERGYLTRTSAPTWEHGLLTGSGRVGAVLYGPAESLRIALAHERFFLPANPRPLAPDLGADLAALRAAVEASPEGSDLSSALTSALTRAGYGSLVWTDPLGLCAAITLHFSGGAHDVERSTDLTSGVVSVSWRDDAQALHRVQLVAIRDTDTVEISWESDADASVTVVMGLNLDDDAPAASFAPDYTGVVRGRAHGGDRPHLDILDRHDDLLAHVDVSATEARWHVVDGTLQTVVAVSAGVRQRLRLDVSVAGHTPAPAPARTEWDALLRGQREGHGALVRSSLLSLNGDETVPFSTTEELWDRARSGEETAIREVVSLAYASGRAHIIASTGELPPTLQGVWQGTWKPAWSADYTMNGNVQNGTVAALLMTGTPELMRSVLRLVLPHLDDYRTNARRIFSAEGMLLPSRMSTHGIANHANADFPHLFWTGAGGWVLRLIADLVSVTGDRSIVDDDVWALAEGVLLFAETATVTSNGLRHLIPSYSPENTPACASSPVAADATIDVAVLRDAARTTRLLGRAREDDSLDERWAQLIAELPDYRVADDGTLAEWIDPRWRENLAHRHVSQLYPLWYEVDSAFLGGSAAALALRAAARKTIELKIAWRAEDPTPPPGRMEMAFGLAQLGLAAAALGEAEAARTCVEWLALQHWRPALTTTHDAGEIFNLDASGALPAVVAAMLLASTADSLRLLPAVPDAWPHGAVTGLRARGGIIVDALRWNEDTVTATLRRLPSADWLSASGDVRISCGPPFAGSESEHSVFHVGTAPIEVTLTRS